MTAKSTTKRPARLQIYISDPNLAEALSQEARQRGLSLSQTAQHILSKGIRYQNQQEAENLGSLENRLLKHARLTIRDLTILQELLFITLRTLCSRLPENPQESNPTYQASVDHQMTLILNEVSDRLRKSRLQSPNTEEGL